MRFTSVLIPMKPLWLHPVRQSNWPWHQLCPIKHILWRYCILKLKLDSTWRSRISWKTGRLSENSKSRRGPPKSAPRARVWPPLLRTTTLRDFVGDLSHLTEAMRDLSRKFLSELFSVLLGCLMTLLQQDNRNWIRHDRGARDVLGA